MLNCIPSISKFGGLKGLDFLNILRCLLQEGGQHSQLAHLNLDCRSSRKIVDVFENPDPTSTLQIFSGGIMV